MANVPDTTTFCFSPDVCAAITPAPNNFVSAFADACPAGYDPSHCGAKNSLLNFQNYCGTPVTSKAISLTCICSAPVAICCFAYSKTCFTSTPPMSAGECFNITIHGTVGTNVQAAGSWACIAIVCGSTCVYNCAIGAGVCCTNPSYTFTITQANRNCWAMCLAACTTNCACPLCSDAYGVVWSISSVVGSFCVGSPCDCNMYTA